MRANDLLTTSEAARMLGVQPQTVRTWRLTGKGPSYIRLGAGKFARAVYDPDEIARWLSARTFTSTANES